MKTFDVAVIGAGTAGLKAYKAASEATDSVALIEGGPLGTTCARTGCMPSKLLIAAARIACAVRDAGTFGIEAPLEKIDGRAVMQRVRKMRDGFVEPTVQQTRDLAGERLMRGHARFVRPGLLDVDGERIEARRIVIATGSRATVPGPIREGVGDRLMTIDDLWEMEALPGRMAVFGAGVIGAETSHALAKLGVEVCCLSKGGAVGGLTDPEMIAAGTEILSRNMELHPDVELGDMGWDDGSLRITYSADGEERTGCFDAALAATGRVPVTDGLDLENAGVALGDDGVPRFDPATRLCEGSEDHPVFVAGDAEGGLMVLPNARHGGEIAGRNAGFWPEGKPTDDPVPLQIVFTRPSIAVVGEPYVKIKDRDDLAIGTQSFEDQGRAKCENRAEGLVRIYAEKGSGRFLGAEMMAPDAEHFGHLIAWGAQAGLTVPEMASLPVYHPVTEEGLRSALRNCAERI